MHSPRPRDSGIFHVIEASARALVDGLNRLSACSLPIFTCEKQRYIAPGAAIGVSTHSRPHWLDRCRNVLADMPTNGVLNHGPYKDLWISVSAPPGSASLSANSIVTTSWPSDSAELSLTACHAQAHAAPDPSTRTTLRVIAQGASVFSGYLGRPCRTPWHYVFSRTNRS